MATINPQKERFFGEKKCFVCFFSFYDTHISGPKKKGTADQTQVPPPRVRTIAAINGKSNKINKPSIKKAGGAHQKVSNSKKNPVHADRATPNKTRNKKK